MKFRTDFDIPFSAHPVSYTHRMLFIGSCFTTNIGRRMQQCKFQVDVNPFGVVYNPASIANSLRLLENGNVFTSADLDYQNGLYFSYAHHSSFSSADREQCLEKMNKQLQQSSDFFKNTNFLFITLGTAYAYRLHESGRVVANCHKTPANQFDRFLLTPEEIVAEFTDLFDSLLKHNQSLKIIFSVSPIRHLKDGVHENQISKACLLLAIDELQRQYPDNCSYFPAYELLLDDLRDYRFYAEDMCHPSEQAVAYIWEKFSEAFIDKTCEPVMRVVDNIVAACAHRPFNAGTEQHKTFVQKTKDAISSLHQQYPFMDFTEELAKLQ